MKSTLKITKSEIRVSANPKIDGGYYFDHHVEGILPGCRKSVVLSISPTYARIWVKPLEGYSGNAHIRPEDWAALVAKSPVKSAFYSPVEITPEIVAKAQADALSLTTCPAVTNNEHVHPNFKITFDALVMA